MSARAALQPCRLSPPCVRVLAAVLALAQAGERVTFKKLLARLGWRSAGYTALHLERLRAAGLVSWEWGRNGTLRPACRLVIYRSESEARNA